MLSWFGSNGPGLDDIVRKLEYAWESNDHKTFWQTWRKITQIKYPGKPVNAVIEGNHITAAPDEFSQKITSYYKTLLHDDCK